MFSLFPKDKNLLTMRILYPIAFLLLTTSIYAQKSTLLQNINVRAKELKHSLNKTGDSLILDGERTIYKVDIFNKDFEQSLIVKDSKVIIPLKDIPVGRFVVEAAMPDRLIVITLLRNETISAPINTPRLNKKVSLFGSALAVTETTHTPKIKATKPKLAAAYKEDDTGKKSMTINKKVTTTYKKVPDIDINTAVIETELTAIDINKTVNNEKFTTAKTLLQNSAHKTVESYWIVYKTNGHSSGKEMRFGDEELVHKMISHINLDKRTKAGKNNELIVWEIYDVSKFLKYKMKNRNNLSSEADCFNVVPYLKIANDLSEF